MQAVLTKTENGFEKIFEALVNVDNTTKNELENNIVKIGSAIVENLIASLKTLSGISRGVVAMSLIRIGEEAIPYLRKAAMKDESFLWVADYIISEIECR